MRIWEWIIVLLLIVILYGLTKPAVIRSGPKANQTEAVSNLRQVGLALSEFEHDYGRMPDATTAEVIQKATETELRLGTTTSNDFFRQLLASGVATSESIFYAETAESHKADNNFEGPKALEKGECGMSYFVSVPENSDPARPLAATPMIPRTDRFDSKIFDRRACILKADLSVTSHTINKNGHAVSKGQNLLDPDYAAWGGHAPTIAWPE